MKFLLIVIATTAAVSAVPPRFNSKYSNHFQRLEDSYLPPTKQQVPHTVYGPPPQEETTPAQQYGPPAPPKPEYGPPQEEPTESPTTEIAAETTTEPFSESINSNTTANNGTAKLREGVEQGIYYVYHPNGLLQKVAYLTKDDVKNMAYTARLKYQNVEPIRESIFTYDPETLVYTKLQR